MLYSQSTYIERYREVRKALSGLQNPAASSAPKELLLAAARKLGLANSEVLLFDNECEYAVLMDYLDYDCHQDGVSLIERYCIDHPPEPGTLAATLVEPIRQARYTLVTVVEGVPGRGVQAWDRFREEPVFLTDEGFSLTADVGLTIATRLVRSPDYTLSTGASLPILPEVLSVLQSAIASAFSGRLPPELLELPPEERAELSAGIIRVALSAGASHQIDHQEAGTRLPSPAEPSRRLESLGPPRRMSRNSPCPCGSGRKWKNCCGRRR